jgi:hypothetical protein
MKVDHSNNLDKEVEMEGNTLNMDLEENLSEHSEDNEINKPKTD